MSYSKEYQRIEWENGPSTNTPINDANLNKIDYMVDVLDTRTVELDGRISNLQGYETRASQSATDAKASEDLSESYAVGTNGVARIGDATDNAKYYMERAKYYAELAQSIAEGMPSSNNEEP